MKKRLKIDEAVKFSYPFVQGVSKKRKGLGKEDQSQMACVRWFSLQYPNILLHHSPNGGSRHLLEGAKFKKMGTVAGFSDIFIMKPARGFHGLFVELKVKPNKLTDKQEEFLQKAKAERYATAVCYSFEEFVKVVTQYLKNS